MDWLQPYVLTLITAVALEASPPPPPPPPAIVVKAAAAPAKFDPSRVAL